MRLQQQTLNKDVRLGLLHSLYGLPMGVVFALIYEAVPTRSHHWLFLFVFVMTLCYSSATEFASEFTACVAMGLLLGLGAMIIVKKIVIAPTMLGLKLAGTYYIAFLIITLIRYKRGTLPI